MLHHPNVHTPWKAWSEEQTLHVVAIYSNPLRYRTRRELFNDFVRQMRHTPNVRLRVVEVAFGDRPFEMTQADLVDVQLRTNDLLWHKESGLNVGLRTLPAGWKYAAYWDGDFTCTRHDWALEAIHQLQHFPFVQLFSGFTCLSHTHKPTSMAPSFAYVYRNYPNASAAAAEASKTPSQPLRSVRCKVRNLASPGATGGGWAFTREAYSQVGGLLDTCVLGSGDWHMAFGLTGEISTDHPETKAFNLAAGKELSDCGSRYGESIRRWQHRAFTVIRGRIGYVDQYVVHHWHGSLQKRSYGTRWQVLRDHGFDPDVDIVRDHQGLWRWAGNKPRLEAATTQYFLNRDEDSTQLVGASELI